MSGEAQYQSIPTATITLRTTITTTTTDGRRRRPAPAGGIGLVMLLVAFGIPLIIYGVFEYRKVRSFNTEPGFCRVKGYDTQRRSEKFTSAVKPLWIVDVVEKPAENDSTKDPIILRPDMRISGNSEHKLSKTALEEATKQYAIGRIYPCYYRRQLLDNTTADSSENNLKNSIQWKKPSRKFAFTLWAIGSALILGGLYRLVIFLLYIRRQ